MKVSELLISIQNLNFRFVLRNQVIHALRGVSLDIYKGECLAIVGESGSGKSALVKCLMGLNDKNGHIESGKILYNGLDLAGVESDKEWSNLRGGKIAMVLQNPVSALNPLKTIGWQIEEAVKMHQGLRGKDAGQKVLKLLEEVGISEPEKRYHQYPHEFSGGMCQRVVIAAALACEPEVLICDEPTTALDVTNQAQIIDLIKAMGKKYGLTTIYITHDFGVAANIADRIAVMYAGDIVETGLCNEIFYDSRHPYTWALLSSLPQLGDKEQALYTIEGTPPSLVNDIRGDAFAPRNPYALKIDFVSRPPVFSITPTHWARTWLLDSRAPEIKPPEHIAALWKKGRELGLLNS